MTQTPTHPAAGDADLTSLLETHRRELTAHCYRMLGSAAEAEDAVQDTLLRAWRSHGTFEGRSSVRTWLYRIATNVCLDSLDGRKRRARPMDFGPASSADTPLPPPLVETAWIEPVPDALVVPGDGDPADVAVARDTIKLAFIAALQHLPPRQRAVLILREVLRWSAAETATLLDTSVASVNSALQRARATLDERGLTVDQPTAAIDAQAQSLLTRYVDAFERYDMDALTSLLREDATWNMPPFDLWLQTHADIRAWCLGQGIGCKGSRLVPTSANGAPAFGQYKPSDTPGVLEPWSLQVLEITDGAITEITFFLDTARFFPMFGLPSSVPA